jgi:hypothetical protein
MNSHGSLFHSFLLAWKRLLFQ